MAQKIIETETIEGLKVRYNALTHYMKEDTDSLIRSSASEVFRDTTASALQVTENLTETVEALDEFLNSVAREFRAMDDKIARVIDGERLAKFDDSKQEAKAAYDEQSGRTKRQIDYAQRYSHGDYPY